MVGFKWTKLEQKEVCSFDGSQTVYTLYKGVLYDGDNYDTKYVCMLGGEILCPPSIELADFVHGDWHEAYEWFKYY